MSVHYVVNRKELNMNEILGKIIDLMRTEGLEIDSPYDIENFFEDYGSHSDMWDTGRFSNEDDDEDE